MRRFSYGQAGKSRATRSRGQAGKPRATRLRGQAGKPHARAPPALQAVEVVGEGVGHGEVLGEHEVRVRDGEEVRFLGVVARDGLEHLVVLVHDGVPLEAFDLRAKPTEALEMRVVRLQRGPYGVTAGDLEDELVEIVVVLEERARVAACHGLFLQVDDVLERVAALVGEARAAFHDHAALEVLAHEAGILGALQVDARNVGAALRDGVDEAELGKAHERLAHRRAAEAELLLEVADGELLAGGEVAVDDVAAQRIVCDVGERRVAGLFGGGFGHDGTFLGPCAGGGRAV